MQKIQSYLYPNRVILIADLAGFTVENTIVYAKTVKIYNGIDNTIQFDIQNADQKRLDLTQYENLCITVMDAAGNELETSPYYMTNLSIQGLATVTIPQTDLEGLDDQYLTYSVSAVDTNGNDILFYTDSKFNAAGTIQLIGNAFPKFRDEIIYDRFQGEINFMGNVINHTSAIPCKFYEATPTTVMNFDVNMTNFIGTIYVEATEDSTISVESFLNATQLQSMTYNVATTTTLSFANVSTINPVTGNKWNYMRISWQFPDVWQYGSQQNPGITYGTVNTVTVIS